ncbi:RIB43A-like with coiled-coils protein 2 [Pelodytes ibericus]
MERPELPRDLHEVARLDCRRNAERQRQETVLNARTRSIGVDKQALDVQVHGKKIQKEIENKIQEQYDAQMIQHDKIACLLDERQKDDIKILNKAIDEFRLCFQKKEDRKEYDLYDPQALKKDLPSRLYDEDPRCSVSGAQVLMGEDLHLLNRKKDQQEQFREWSLQQQEERARALEDKKVADDLYDRMRTELDQKAMELQRMEDNAKKAVCSFTKDFNKAQAEEFTKRKELERNLEEHYNAVEICNLIEGDLLSENPSQACSAFGPHRIVPDRWKGMSSEQREEIINIQQEQIQERMRLKEEERQRAAESDRQRVQAARAMLLLERQQKRQDRELRKAQDHINLQLAQAHKAQKIYYEKEVFTNNPTDLYFEQFNTTSR